MNSGSTTINISVDEYDALRALQARSAVFESLARTGKYMSINDALVILGFEPIEEEKNAGEPDAD